MANKPRLPTAFASPVLRLHTHEITCPAVYSAGTGNPNSGFYACAASALPIELVFPTSKVADTWLKDSATPDLHQLRSPLHHGEPHTQDSALHLVLLLGFVCQMFSLIFMTFLHIQGNGYLLSIRPHIGCRVQGLKDKLPLLRQEYLGFLHFKQCYYSTEKTGVKMTVLLCSPSGSTN